MLIAIGTCSIAAVERAAFFCLLFPSASGTISGASIPWKMAARCCGAPSIWESPISTWPTTTARLYGSAEENFGLLFRQDWAPYRDELIISTKAGYDMWPGPYGNWGSRKYLLASLDQSLRRMGLEYVDIFYSHRPDPETPLEETMMALDQAVRSGKALYAGISNYDAERTAKAAEILRRLGTPCLIHQMKYSMFVRWSEEGLLRRTEDRRHRRHCLQSAGAGPVDGSLPQRHSRRLARVQTPGFLKANEVDEAHVSKARKLQEWPASAANRWRRWRWHGCCAMA